MLNRSQKYTLFLASQRGVFNRPDPKDPDLLVNALPNEMIMHAINVSDGAYDPNGDIAILLHHIAFGDLEAVKDMLDKNPRLVLEAGNTVTRSGLTVECIAPLELALGSGSPQMVYLVDAYFDAECIDGGAEVRRDQYARYRPHIEKMLEHHKPYDLNDIVTAILEATPAEIAAALDNNLDPQSKLHIALQKFRAHFTPDKMKIGMHLIYNEHCNPSSIINMLYFYSKIFDALRFGDNFDRNRVYCRLVIGFIERSLDYDERCIFATHTFAEAARDGIPSERSLIIKPWPLMSFPDTVPGANAQVELGIDYDTFMDVGAYVYSVNEDLARHFQRKQKILLEMCKRRLENNNVVQADVQRTTGGCRR